MFGLTPKRKCQYCETPLPFLSDVCTYCGQKQKPEAAHVKTASEHVTADFAAEHEAARREASASSARATVPHKTPPTPTAVLPATEVIAAVRKIQSSETSPGQTRQAAQEGCAVKTIRFAFAGFWFLTISELMNGFRATDFGTGEFGEFAGTLSVLAALLVIAFAGDKILWRLAIIPVSFLNAAILLIKPMQFPITVSWMRPDGVTGSHALSYTSESHLYFVLPGIALLMLGMVNILALLRTVWRKLVSFGK